MFEGLKCLDCKEFDTISLRLSDGVFTCCECDAEHTSQEIQKTLNDWVQVLSWVSTAPTLKPVE